jgi:hydrogenase maturation protease
MTPRSSDETLHVPTFPRGMKPPLLVLGVGNPSRGDDALGALFVDRAEATLRSEVDRGQVEFLTDFQLQVEHALDLVGRRRVVFVDASVQAVAPYQYARVAPDRDASFSSHAMSPAAVLDAHRTVVGEPPPAWTLAIRGDRFELGDDLTPAAAANLEAALAFFVDEARSFLRQGEDDEPEPGQGTERAPAHGE